LVGGICPMHLAFCTLPLFQTPRTGRHGQGQ
jgi:hypothetical protein